MIIKKETSKLVVFNKQTGITSYFSGQELSILLDYIENKINHPFITRLFSLGVISTYEKLNKAYINYLNRGKNIGSIKSIHIELTSFCPLSCPQCYQAEGPKSNMDYSTLKKLIDEAYNLGIFQIALAGGEGLYYPKLVDIIEYISPSPMAVSLTTSGFGLDKNYLDKLINGGINHIQVSLNGSNSKVNGLSRSNFKDSIEAIKLISKTNLSFGINWVGRKDNLEDFPNILKLGKKYNVENINILRYKPSPLEDYNKNKLSLKEEFKLAEFIRNSRLSNIKVDSAYSNLLHFINKNPNKLLTYGCGGGREFISINSRGEFSPCSQLPLYTSSPSIYEYINSNSLNNFFKESTTNSNLCPSCIYKKNCNGCRAICLNTTGSLSSGEENCLAYRKIT